MYPDSWVVHIFLDSTAKCVRIVLDFMSWSHNSSASCPFCSTPRNRSSKSFQNIMIWQGFQIWTIFIMQHSDRIVSYCTLTSSHVVVIVSYSHCCRCMSKNPNPIKNVANSRMYYYHLSGINRRINVLKLCDKHAGQLQWTSKTSDRVCWFGL